MVLEDFATADGWMGKLYPFTKTLDLSALPPGDYTLVALHRRPVRRRGQRPFTDTRTSPSPDRVGSRAKLRAEACSCAPRCRCLAGTLARTRPGVLNRTLLPASTCSRGRMPVPEMVAHLVGLQAQENLPPYLSLARG